MPVSYYADSDKETVELGGEKMKEKMKEKKKISKKLLKNGSYTMGISVVFIAAVVLVNLIVGELPSKYSQIDISDSGLYSICLLYTSIKQICRQQ